MAEEIQTGEVLEGHVEIDGAYFGEQPSGAGTQIPASAG